jgi:hypothetical protein
MFSCKPVAHSGDEDIPADDAGDDSSAGLAPIFKPTFAMSLVTASRNHINRKTPMNKLRSGGDFIADDVELSGDGHTEDENEDGKDSDVDDDGNIMGLLGESETINDPSHAEMQSKIEAQERQRRISQRVRADLQTSEGVWLYSPEEMCVARLSIMTEGIGENVSVLTQDPSGPFTLAVINAIRSHTNDRVNGATVVLVTNKAILLRLCPREEGALIEDWTGIPRNMDVANVDSVRHMVQALKGRKALVKRYRNARSVVIVGSLSAAFLSVFNVVAGILRKQPSSSLGGLHVLHFAHAYEDAHLSNALVLSPEYELMFRHRLVVGNICVDSLEAVTHALFEVRASSKLDAATRQFLQRRVKHVERPGLEGNPYWCSNVSESAPSRMKFDMLIITTDVLAAAANRSELINLIQSKNEGGEHQLHSFVASGADDEMQKYLQSCTALPYRLNVCIGAQVILLVDLPTVPAGSIGIVTGFANDPPFPVVEFQSDGADSDRIRTHVLFTEFHFFHPLRGSVKVKAVPLRLAWALGPTVVTAMRINTEVYVDVRNLVEVRAPLHMVFDSIVNPGRDLYLMHFDPITFQERYRDFTQSKHLDNIAPALQKILKNTQFLVERFCNNDADVEAEDESDLPVSQSTLAVDIEM